MKKLITNIVMDDKFILVVEKLDAGKSNKYDVIYAIDDEDVMWVHKKGGASRGSRIACISNDTFFDTLEAAQQGLQYLRGCFFTFYNQIKIMTVSQLKENCLLTYEMLMHDVFDYNEEIMHETNAQHAAEREAAEKAAKLMQQFREGEILDYERDADEGVYIVTIKIKQ